MSAGPTGRARPRGSWSAVAIRGLWTFVFPGLGFAITYVVDQWTTLGLPTWTGLVIGSVCYMLKKRYFPASTW